jgi:Carboxypeptidase regulatory-like domain
VGRWLARFLMALSAYLSLVETTAPQEAGTISGTVTDEHGAPVGKAKVNADPADGRPRGSLLHFVETDDNGHFRIERLSVGKYKVFAKKEDLGYPDMRWSFYSNDVYPTVEITPTNQNALVRVQLGPKGGILTGSVTNALTGAPIYASFKLARAAFPNKWISPGVPPDYRILLPSSTDVMLEVSAPGFKNWNFPSPLNLQPGAEMHLDIPLEPAHDPRFHPCKFLVPDGYVGWVQLEHDIKDAQPIPLENGVRVFKFPESGVLSTSSPGPEMGADDEYLFYSQDGSRHQIPQDYRNGKAMIWGRYQGSRAGIVTLFGFFVGTEEQYRKYQSQTGHPGPIPSP